MLKIKCHLLMIVILFLFSSFCKSTTLFFSVSDILKNSDFIVKAEIIKGIRYKNNLNEQPLYIYTISVSDTFKGLDFNNEKELNILSNNPIEIGSSYLMFLSHANNNETEYSLVDTSFFNRNLKYIDNTSKMLWIDSAHYLRLPLKYNDIIVQNCLVEVSKETCTNTIFGQSINEKELIKFLLDPEPEKN